MDIHENLQRMFELAMVDFIRWVIAYKERRLTGAGSFRTINEATNAGRWIFESSLDDPLGFDNVIGVLFEEIDPDYIRRKLREYCLKILAGEEVDPLPNNFLGGKRVA